jgi:hypothetical protein
VTAKTAALPNVNTIMLSPEVPGEAATAATAVPGGVVRAGMLK